MKKKIERIMYDLRSLPDSIRAYYDARRNRDVMVCLFRGFRTDAEAKEYLETIDKMEKHLSFPIINKKGYKDY